MPGISRKGDQLTTGHTCAGVTILDTPTQSTVRANNIVIARKTDKTVSHPFSPPPLCPPICMDASWPIIRFPRGLLLDSVAL